MNNVLKCLVSGGVGIAMLAAGASAALAKDLKKVTYAIATNDLNVGYPFATLAKQLGYFEEEGLDVTIVPGQNSAATAQLLLSGRADVGVSQPNAVMIQRANANIPLISFYAVSRRVSNMFVVKPDSPIQSIKDFKGKKVGVGDLGASSVTYMQTRMIQAGMKKNDVEIISTGYGTPGYEALNNGVVDVASSFSGGIARQRMAGYDVRTLPQSELDLKQYSYNLYATADYIKANPDVIRGIGRATAKATVYMRNNPEAAARAFWDYSPDRAPKDRSDAKALERDVTILKAQMRDMAADDNPDSFAWGSQDTETYRLMQEDLMLSEQIKKPADPAIFFTNEFAADYVKFDTAAIAAQAKAAK